MVTKARSAADRLAAVKRGIKQIEAARDQLMARWGVSLLDDDENAVERCERRLDALEWKLRRSQKLIDLLPPQIAREREQQAQKELPTSREQARARRLALQPRLVQLDSIPWNARNAGQQAEHDTLRQQDYYFAGLERTLPSEAALSKESA